MTSESESPTPLCLTIVSLGPGEPSLLTLQALAALRRAATILVPCRSPAEFERSRSRQILARLSDYLVESGQAPLLLDRLEPLHSPMRYREEDWQLQLEQLCAAVERSRQVAYVTLGDAAIYSGAYHLLPRLEERWPELFEQTVVLPGISAPSYASALARRPLCLGAQRLEIYPLAWETSATTRIYMRPPPDRPAGQFDAGGELWHFANLGFAEQSIALLDRSADQLLESGAGGEGDEAPHKRRNYLSLWIDFALGDPSPEKKG